MIANPVVYTPYPQGQTVYSVQASSQVYGADPSLALQAAQTAVTNATKTLTQAIQTTQSTNAEANKVAQIQALTQHLKVLQQSLKSGTTAQTQKVTSQQLATGKSVFQSKCASCHGKDKASPSGGLYLFEGVKLKPEQGMRVMELISGVNIPAKMETVMKGLSSEERQALMQETLIAYRRKE